MTKEQLNLISKGCFPEVLGIKVTAINGASIHAEMPIQPAFLAPNTYLHAGSIVTFADTIAGYSTMLNLPKNAKSFTTIELKSNFLRTLKEGVLECESEPEHLGRTTQIWRIQVLDKATKKVLAIFSCTQMILY